MSQFPDIRPEDLTADPPPAAEPITANTIRRIVAGQMTTGQLLVSWRSLIELANANGIHILLSAGAAELDATQLVAQVEAFKVSGCPACEANRFHTADEYDANHPQV